MMCEYCEGNKVMLSEGVVEDNGFGYSKESTKTHEYVKIFSYVISVFVDRGYLRLVDLGDSQCMDHGERIKIEFCPMCGKELHE
jgi:hypothetical protein